jgi:hypothetical protein
VGLRHPLFQAHVAEQRSLALVTAAHGRLSKNRYPILPGSCWIRPATDRESGVFHLPVKTKKLGLPLDSAESFELLHRAALIPIGMVENLKGMARFRIVLVHAYKKLNLAIIVLAAESHALFPGVGWDASSGWL